MRDFTHTQALGPVVDAVVQQLVSRRIVIPGEFYRWYAVPRYDDLGRFNGESMRQYLGNPDVVKYRELNGNRSGWYSVEQMAGKSLAYISLLLLLSPRPERGKGYFVYERDVALSELQFFVDTIIETGISEGAIPASHLPLTWSLSAHLEVQGQARQGELGPMIVLVTVEPTPGAVPSSERPPAIASTQSLSSPAAPSGQVDLELVESVDIAPKTDLQVMIDKSVSADIQQQARHVFDRELAGLLLGHVAESDGAVRVRIVTTLAAPKLVTTADCVRIDPDGWSRLHSLASDKVDLQIVGWYHIHLKGGIFHEADQALHRTYFDDPHQVALVYDLSRRGFVAFRLIDERAMPVEPLYEV